MVERKVDGIVFIPTDNNAAIPAIRTANAANIPIIFFNRPPAPNENSIAIQADNRKIMQLTVSALVDIAKKQGGKYKAVLLMGDLGDNNAVQRRDGALDILDANKDLVEVVSRVATEWNADKAFAGLTNAIQANPDVNLLISPSDSQDNDLRAGRLDLGEQVFLPDQHVGVQQSDAVLEHVAALVVVQHSGDRAELDHGEHQQDRARRVLAA